MQYPSRASACRRELNSHDAAEPREVDRPLLRATLQTSVECELTEHCRRVTSRVAANRKDEEPPCHVEPSHCVGGPGIQSVCGAAAANTAASGLGHLRRRLEYAARHGRQRGAGSDWCGPPGVTGPGRLQHQRSKGAALPNPSLKGSTNGGPPGPVRRYAVHFRQPGPGVPPLAPP